jgi:hypothetical protein
LPAPRGLAGCAIASVGQARHLVGITEHALWFFISCYSPRKTMKQKSGKASHTITKASKAQWQHKHPYVPQPELQLIYDTAPVGLAFLTCDCRYVQINQRLTEI